MNRKGRTSIARVRRAHEMSAVLGLATPLPGALREAVEEGTSHSGVTRDRPERRRRKVMPRPVELQRVNKFCRQHNFGTHPDQDENGNAHRTM